MFLEDVGKEAIVKIAKNYTEPQQVAKAVEELAELSQVLAKYLANGGTYKDYKNKLVEELADVIIMLEQIVFLEGVDEKDILTMIATKIERQLGRIHKKNFKIALNHYRDVINRQTCRYCGTIKLYGDTEPKLKRK